MALHFVERPSPNHDPRPAGAAVDILVLHYTGMRTAEEALDRLCDPEAKVSSHYTIDRDGCIYRHVDEDRRARHAGVSWWAGERDVNGRSIGIELVNPGHEFGYVPFPEAQIDALMELAHAILARHPVPANRVVGHSDVAPARKMDPGELFPWRQLADAGIGVFPPPSWGRWPEGPEGDFADMLRQFGYGVAPDLDIPLTTVTTAFQRHFRPEKVDGIADDETQARLWSLVSLNRNRS
ncbi:MAG TPA: N-acetylmuramoyl-L-alanine amidase [Rhizomicrobium sp.]|nr:N-acetylmuramoyl-L-alanine amidase [Rhizomicrobium sp.]